MEDEKVKHTSKEFEDCVQDGIDAYNKIGNYYNEYLSKDFTNEENRGEDEDERE